MKNSDMPAMPQTFAINDAGDLESSASYEDASGLTKREYFAAKALQGLLANEGTNDVSCSDIAFSAVSYADDLLKALEE